MDTKLVGLLSEIFGLKHTEIKPELKKCEIDSWDSLKQMDLVVSIENAYGIQLDISDIVRMDSIHHIIEVLKEKGVILGN